MAEIVLRDHRILPQPPSKVWRYLSHLPHWPAFVAKLQRVESLGGNRYRLVLRRRTVEGEFRSDTARRRLGLRGQVNGRAYDIEYYVEPLAQGRCRVTETVRAEVPLPVKWLMWWTRTFGYRRGASNLERLNIGD